jgi:hypothetical protein
VDIFFWHGRPIVIGGHQLDGRHFQWQSVGFLLFLGGGGQKRLIERIVTGRVSALDARPETHVKRFSFASVESWSISSCHRIRRHATARPLDTPSGSATKNAQLVPHQSMRHYQSRLIKGIATPPTKFCRSPETEEEEEAAEQLVIKAAAVFCL